MKQKHDASKRNKRSSERIQTELEIMLRAEVARLKETIKNLK